MNRAMRTILKILSAFLMLPMTGCYVGQTLHQSSSPDLKILMQQYGATVIPGWAGSLYFYDQPLDDERFAAAIQYIRAYEPRALCMDSSRLTDASLPTFMQLGSVRRLYLGHSGLGMESLVALKGLPNLEWIGIHLDGKDSSRLQRAIGPDIWIVCDEPSVSEWTRAALTNRVTMLAAARVAWDEFRTDVGEFIHGLTMPP